MRYTFLNEVLGLESRLEGTHVDAGVHLEQIDFLQSDVTTDLTGAHVKMGEARADDLFFVIFVFNGMSELLARLVVAEGHLLNQVYIVFNSMNLISLLHVDVLHILSGVEFTLMLVDHL